MDGSPPVLPPECRSAVDEALALLAAADGLRSAISDEDADAVHAWLCVARNALAHLRWTSGRPAGARPEALCVDLRRLLHLVDRLLMDAPGSRGPCGCVGNAGPVADQLIALARLHRELPSAEPGRVLPSYENYADRRD